MATRNDNLAESSAYKTDCIGTVMPLNAEKGGGWCWKGDEHGYVRNMDFGVASGQRIERRASYVDRGGRAALLRLFYMVNRL